MVSHAYNSVIKTIFYLIKMILGLYYIHYLYYSFLICLKFKWGSICVILQSSLSVLKQIINASFNVTVIIIHIITNRKRC